MTPIGQRIVRVLPDVTGIDKTFDYLVDDPSIRVGTEVRVRLGPRSVRGWIVAVDVAPPIGVRLQPVTAIRGVGPSSEVVDLARWGAHRWAGHPAQLLRIASAPTVVRALPSAHPRSVLQAPTATRDPLVAAALSQQSTVVRLPPAMDRTPFMVELLTEALDRPGGPAALVVCPSLELVRRLVPRLRSVGFAVADVSAEGPASVRSAAWAHAAGGGAVVVGTRNAAWAPAPDLALAVVVDEHDEALKSTRTPSWHAREVLRERARRAGAPLVMLSACPSLEALAGSNLVTVTRSEERAGWPELEIIDRRGEDPRTASSVFSENLARLIDHPGRIVCVLNRVGRARLLACRQCGALARCDACGAAVRSSSDDGLVCPRCAAVRPRLCTTCGSSALKILRIGVSRAREELEALIGEPVTEVTATSAADATPTSGARVRIGTEAVLHRAPGADLVVFLDIDAELTAPRYRATEQALTLVTRAARLLGSRGKQRRLVVQTRMPDHPVLRAVAQADPTLVTDAEGTLRSALAFPPYSALALISGATAAPFVQEIDPHRVEILPSGDGQWLIRAPDHARLADVLAAAARPGARPRIEVDPLGI